MLNTVFFFFAFFNKQRVRISLYFHKKPELLSLLTLKQNKTYKRTHTANVQWP